MNKTQDPKETKKNVFDFLQQKDIFQLKFWFDLFKKKDAELVFNHKNRYQADATYATGNVSSVSQQFRNNKWWIISFILQFGTFFADPVL